MARRNPTPSVPLWRARLELEKMGLFAQVDAYVEAHKGDNPAFYQAWNYGNFVERNSAFVKFMQPLLKLTDEQVEAMFRDAAKSA